MAVVEYFKQGFISFAFTGISTYLNSKNEEKKKPINMPLWNTINKENCLNYQSGNAVAIITGKISNLTVIDFDNIHEYDKFVSDFPIVKTYKTIKSPNGYHIYFNYYKELLTGVDVFQDYKHIDIRNDNSIIFSPPTSYKLLNHNVVSYVDIGGIICDIPDFIKNLKLKNKTILKSNAISIMTNKLDNDIKMIDIIEKGLLDSKAENYDDWIKIGLAFFNSYTYDFGLNLFHMFSMRSTKYDSSSVNNFWNNFKDSKDNKITIASIYKFVKELSIKFIPIEEMKQGPSNISDYIKPVLFEILKFSNDKWFMFYDVTNLWIETKSPSKIIINTIRTFIDFSTSKTLDLRRNSTDEKEQKKLTEDLIEYQKMYSHIDKGGFYNMMIHHLQTDLLDPDFYMLLDNHQGKLAFKNGILDLKTLDFTCGFKLTDYITKTIPFNYYIESNDKIKVIDDILFKIMNCNNEHLEYYKSIIGHALTGFATYEKSLYFHLGIGADNGKSVIFSALNDIMPNYVHKLDRQTFEKGYSKAHKGLSHVIGKRIVYLEEMSSKMLNVEMLKEISSESSFDNEIMFGTTKKTPIHFKLFFLTNIMPSFNADNGIASRYRQITHTSSFRSTNKIDDFEKLSFIRDVTLGDKLRSELKMALLSVFIEQAHLYLNGKKIITPIEFIEASNDTIASNGNIEVLFNKYVEYGNDLRCSKIQLEDLLGIPFSKFKNEINMISGCVYVKDLNFYGIDKKGGWKGFSIIKDDDETDCEDEN